MLTKLTTTMAPKHRQTTSKPASKNKKQRTAPASLSGLSETVSQGSLPRVGVNPVAATSTASRAIPFNFRTGQVVVQPATTVPTVVELNNDGGTAGSSSNNCAEWYEHCRKKGRMGSDAMLRGELVAFVRNHLFAKLKFFMDPRQLLFSADEHTICYQICHEMNLMGSRAVTWWELFKHVIVQALNSKRADVTQAIKRTFISKLHLYVLLLKYSYS
jgi:hypothetical protein